MKDLGLYTSKQFDEFHGQNDIIDSIDGCLLDNFLYYDEDKRLYVVALEYATTTWTSVLHLYIGEETEMFEMWNKLREEHGKDPIQNIMKIYTRNDGITFIYGKINMKKLAQYVEDGDILEFESDQKCMEWFNTYDYQDFKTTEEMKVYQDRYGFNIGRKRYHILLDDALDVFF